MKKIVVIVISFMILMSISGCSSSKAWSDKDFVFYNQLGFTVLKPEIGDMTVAEIYLNDAGKNAMTYRRVKIGDNALKALEKYDLTDSEFMIFNAANPSENEAVTSYYQQKAADGAELLEYLDEICSKNLSVHFVISLYKQNGKLVTKSDLNYDKIPAYPKDFKNVYDYRRLYNVYIFEVTDMKIAYVTTWNAYYSHISSVKKQNNGVIPDTDEYDWLRALGE